MFIEITTTKNERRIVNTDKILYCYEYKERITFEMEDGTPIDTVHTRPEIERVFLNYGMVFAIL